MSTLTMVMLVTRLAALAEAVAELRRASRTVQPAD